MSKIALFVALAIIPFAASAADAVPDLKGTWKGESESILMGAGNPHHQAAKKKNAPELRSLKFTATIDMQEGRRFSGTFASARGKTPVIGVISRNNTIVIVDEKGYTQGTILAPNKMEWCYQHTSATSQIASCTELTKQP
jgi:hypothetical protein